jgi:CheY-like chemotaxis protein
MKKILIVDDAPLILYGLSKTLGNLAEVRTVTTGDEAIRESRSGFYDLCFLDIYLPDSNGLDVMRRIKEISPRTRVAIMTGSHVNEDMKQAIEKQADYFIPKPFKLSQVKIIAKRALEEERIDGLV